MKRSYYLLMLAFLCLWATPAYAQSDVKVTFHVSFPFNAGAAVMPAGAYTITEDGSGHALISPVQGGHATVILLTRTSSFAPYTGHASVSFVERGGRYYLDAVNLMNGAVVGVIRASR
jgi:hypothetical protein